MPINNISLNEDLWIQVKPYLVSFGFKWLPYGVHFTIVFDENQEDMNLHITKNIGDPNNKLQIQILRINREFFKKDINHMNFLLLNKCLEFVDIEELVKKYSPEIYFISIDNIEESSGIENKILTEFNDISKLKRKNTRLKINGSIESKLRSIAYSEDMYSVITDNLIILSPNTQMFNDSGIIITETNIIPVFKIENEWVTFKTNIKPLDLLAAIVRTSNAIQLYWKTMRAIIEIKNAQTFHDVEKHGNTYQLKRPKRNKYYSIQKII